MTILSESILAACAVLLFLSAMLMLERDWRRLHHRLSLIGFYAPDEARGARMLDQLIRLDAYVRMY